ncbi:hypothetical protein IAR50_001452 [Cryptococcus sp. DSM 104548]
MFRGSFSTASSPRDCCEHFGYAADTQRQLDHILAAIQSSRPVLIKIAKFLLSECRQRSAQQQQSSTLSSLCNPSLGGKRKRSITHYEGIPISAISAASLSPSLSSSPTFTPTSSPAGFHLHSRANGSTSERRVISLKRVMGFHQTMSGLSVGERGSWYSAGSGGDDAYQFACGYMNHEKKPQIPDDSESDEEDHIESDSGDEDDVVLVFDRPVW